MIKNFQYKKISFTYCVFLISILIMCCILHKAIYNNLVVIDDKEKVLNNMASSIPVKLDLYSKRWGNTTVKDSNIIKELWNIVESMPKGKSFCDSKTQNPINDITGTVYYLDGKKSTLNLNNDLRINDIYYGGEDSLAYINRIKNYINNIFCIPSNLASLINDKNKIVIIDKFDNIKKCGSNDKVLIKNKILKLKKLVKNTSVEKAIDDKKNLKYHLRIYIEKIDTISEKPLRYKDDDYDIINIDIYENDYIIIKDYGHEIVNVFYMKGDLNSIMEEIV